MLCEEKRRQEAGPTRIGRKKRKKGVEQSTKLPQSKFLCKRLFNSNDFSLVVPMSKCRLRLLRQERVKDYLLMEEEFIKNQERLKPIDESRQQEIA